MPYDNLGVCRDGTTVRCEPCPGETVGKWTTCVIGFPAGCTCPELDGGDARPDSDAGVDSDDSGV